MRLERQSISYVRRQVLGDLEASEVPISFRGLLANALAGLYHMIVGHAENLYINALPDTATGKRLFKWGSLWGVVPKPFTPSVAKISVSGLVGSVIPKQWVIGSTIFEYFGTLKVLKSDKIEIEISSKTPILKDYSGDKAMAKTAQEGIESEALIVSYKIGTQNENEEDYRSRVIKRISYVPQGGAPQDYIVWLESLPEIYQAWVRPSNLSKKKGVVEVAYVCKNYHKTPQTAKSLKDAKEILETLAPAHADVKIVKLKAVPAPFRVSITPDTPELKNAVNKAIRAAFEENSEPKGFLNFALKKTDGKIKYSFLARVILGVPGVSDFEIDALASEFEAQKNEVLIYDP